MGKETLKRIDEIVGRINTHPEYSVCARNRITEMIRIEAIKHSASLETQLDERMEKEERKKRIKKDIQSLRVAHDFLATEGISLYSLSVLGSKVETGENNGILRRNVEGSSHRYGDIECPPAGVVLDLLKNLVGYLTEEPNVHPVSRAINAHLSLVYIHPYEDGNGRAARLLQNFCLEQRNYPQTLFKDNERELYIALLNPAIKEFMVHRSPYGGDGSGEKTFHDFVGSKVLNSAEGIKKELDRLRVYNVELHNMREEGTYYAVRSTIINYGRASNKPLKVEQIRGRNGNKAQVRVIGDIGYDELKTVLWKSSKKRRFSYEIRIDKC